MHIRVLLRIRHLLTFFRMNALGVCNKQVKDGYQGELNGISSCNHKGGGQGSRHPRNPYSRTGEHEVCIAVHFAGINFADTLMRLGFYRPRPPFPFTPGYEVNGVVHAMGKRVEGFEIGQRVVGLMRTEVKQATSLRMLRGLC